MVAARRAACAPTAIERAKHMVTHTPQQPWCEYCVLGYGASKPHERRTFEQKDTSRAMVYVDYAYMKTNGEFVPTGMASPAVADLFAITLIMIDRDTLCMRAISMPTKMQVMATAKRTATVVAVEATRERQRSARPVARLAF